jgi:hypothetical protein
MLKNGKSGRIIGVDPIRGSYQVMTSNNRSVRVKADEIESLEKPKDSKYQQSGINKYAQTELMIKDTPFDLDQDK